eukprot:2778279-Pyramimonas_sp.AAC.1
MSTRSASCKRVVGPPDPRHGSTLGMGGHLTIHRVQEALRSVAGAAAREPRHDVRDEVLRFL